MHHIEKQKGVMQKLEVVEVTLKGDDAPRFERLPVTTSISEYKAVARVGIVF